MRVKITKTIDDNQVPAEIRRMIDQCKNTFMYSMLGLHPCILLAVLEVEGHGLHSLGQIFDKLIFYLVNLT
mgnify:CR=1 FL=1